MIARTKIRILELSKLFFQKGVSLRKISLSVSLGAALGVFPVLGVTTLLCSIAAFVFRLNFPAIQAVNYMVYPLQLILLVPFYNAGSWLFSGRSIFLRQENIIEVLKNNFWGSMADLWDLTIHAVFAWLIVSPFFVLICYGLLKPVIHRLVFSGAMAHSGVETSSKQPFGNDKA